MRLSKACEDSASRARGYETMPADMRARRAAKSSTTEGARPMNQIAMTASKMTHPKDELSMNGQMGLP